MEERKNFRDKNAGRYDRFMRKDAAAYAKMYELIRPTVRHKTVPEPKRALREIRRVLRDDGILIAPTFTHADNSFSGKIRAYFMKLAGFSLHSEWSSGGYLAFLEENGWAVQKSTVLKASFPLIYAECVKSEV